jgi:uncharacterized membrane protein YdjX (TVP38/TMEM64 family)
MIALAVNLSISYWIARSGLRTVLARWLTRLGHPVPDLDGGGRRALRFTFALKLAPGLPASLKNYVLGMVGVPFGVYLGVSMLVTGAYAVVLVVLGESLIEHDLGKVGAIAGVFLMAAVGWMWWRKKGSAHRDRSAPSGTRARTGPS